METKRQQKINEIIEKGVGAPAEDVVLKDSLVEAQVVIETYQNGTSWYRVWSNNLCEQWGSANSNATVTLLKSYKDTNFSVLANPSVNGQYYGYFSAYATGVNTFYVREYGHTGTINWYTCGYVGV